MIKKVDKMLQCGLLVYVGQAEAIVATTRSKKTEDTLV